MGTIFQTSMPKEPTGLRITLGIIHHSAYVVRFCWESLKENPNTEWL